MSLEFDNYELSEFCTFSYGKMPKKDRILDDCTKFPIFSGYQIVGYYDEYNIDKNELILIARGVGGTGDVKLTPAKCFLTNLSIAFSIDQTYALTKFLYYYFQVNNLKYLDSGSAQSQITINNLKRVKVQLPPLKVQSKIIEIIDTLDEKINMNKKINRNLEELCHIIFKYYFVDFIPFNEEKFVDSIVGKIPKTWDTTTVGKILDCKLGGTPSKSNKSYWGGDIAWINSGKINEFRIIEPSEYITDEGLKKSATKLLPAKTTVIAITGATLGQISLLEIDSCANQSVIGIIPNNNYPYEFIYPLISSILNDLLKRQTGGAQQHINKNDVESFNIICPPQSIILEYKTIVESLYSKISNNCFEIKKLQDLRDTLLPQLMSGEIDLSKINCDL